MKEETFKGRTFGVVGRFGHVRVMQHVESELCGPSGVVVDETTGNVCGTFGPDERNKDWQSAVREQGVSLFRLVVNGTARVYGSDAHECVNAGLSLLMTESAPSAPVVVDDYGETVATLARTTDGGRLQDVLAVVWADGGRVERWRGLTFVVVNGETVALVGLLNGRIVQV